MRISAIQSVSESLLRFQQRIEEKSRDVTAAPVLIVALGDSVTQGTATSQRIMHEHVYHAQLKRLLQQRHPLCTFSVINAGVGGATAPCGANRLERDVLSHQPDLVLIAFGLNDAVSKANSGLEEFTTTIEAMLARIRQDTAAEVVLLTPNMLCTRDNDLVPDYYRHLVPRFLDIQNNGVLADYAESIRAIARMHQVPVADVYAKWEAMAAHGIDTTAMLANGLNHPDELGHRWAAETIDQVMAGCHENRPVKQQMVESSASGRLALAGA